MDPRKGGRFWVLTICLTVLCGSISPAQGFFFPRFFNRRQVFPPQQQQQPLQPASSARGQVGDGFHHQGPNLRIVNRPNPNIIHLNSNGGTVPNPSFHVPKALCLACENFPWTPVAGKENSIAVPVGAGNQLSPQTEPRPLPPPQEQPKQQAGYNNQQQQQQQSGVNNQNQQQPQPGFNNQNQQQPLPGFNNQNQKQPQPGFNNQNQKQPQPGFSNQNQQQQSGYNNQKPQQQSGYPNQIPPEQVLADAEHYPVHQHLEVTKEPGGTVVINALGPYPQPQGNRKPFAFQFDSTQSQNNVGNFVQSAKPIGSPIVVPYEIPKATPTLLKPAPYPTEPSRPVQNTNAFSFNTQPTTPEPTTVEPQGYAPSGSEIVTNFGQSGLRPLGYNRPPTFNNQNHNQPPFQQQRPGPPPTLLIPVKNPNSYNVPLNKPAIYLVNPNGNQPQSQPAQPHPAIHHHGHQKVQPITVGTIVAAQHNLHLQDIQPAQLIYQEHTHIHGAPQHSYRPPTQGYAPVQPKPQGQYGHPPSSPHSFKLPIISRPNHQNGHNGFGTIKFNQIPVASVPNHAPHNPGPFQGQQGGYSTIPQHMLKFPPGGYSPVPAPGQQGSYGAPRPNSGPPQQGNQGQGGYAQSQPNQGQGGFAPQQPNQGQGGFAPQQPNQGQGGYVQSNQNQGQGAYAQSQPNQGQGGFAPQQPNQGQGGYVQSQPNKGQGGYSQPRPIQIQYEAQRPPQLNQVQFQPQQGYESPRGPKLNYGPPSPNSIPQRPAPPARPYRPQPPQPSYGEVPLPQREMRPPPPTYIPPQNSVQPAFGSPPSAFQTEDSPPEYNNPVFENVLETNEEEPDDFKDQGTVSFPTPQATLELGPAPSAEDRPASFSPDQQPTFGSRPEIHIQVTNDPYGHSGPITIPNLLRIQPQQGYFSQGPGPVQHQFVVPAGTKGLVSVPEYAQASFSSYVHQRQPFNSLSESEGPTEAPFSGPAPTPSESPAPFTGPVLQSTEFVGQNSQPSHEFVNQNSELSHEFVDHNSQESHKFVDQNFPQSHEFVSQNSQQTQEFVSQNSFHSHELVKKPNPEQSNEFVKNPNIQSLDPAEADDEKEVQPEQKAVTPKPFEPSGPPTGAYEIIPATQYDITHLFTKAPEGSATGRPFPVPIPESNVANPKTPFFVVDQADRHIPYPKPIIHQRPSIVQHSNAQTFFQSQPFTHQAQYDPLPPSIVSALHHAQRTSFLTHTHLTPSKPNTVYVNSVPVNASPVPEPTPAPPTGPVTFEYTPAPPSTHFVFEPTPAPSTAFFGQPQPAHSGPFAFDLDTGKPIRVHEEIDPETQSLKTVIQSDEESESKKGPPEEVVPSSSNLAIETNEQEVPDQTVVNCNNNHQWAVPSEGGAATESSQQGDSRKQFVYYYPSPMSSIYWVEQPQVKTSEGGGFGDRIRVDKTQQNPIESQESAPKTIYSKPILKWSKVLEPSGKANNVVTADFSNSFAPVQIEGEGAESSGLEEPISTPAPYDIHANAHVPQIDEQVLDESVEAGEPEVQSPPTTTGPPLLVVSSQATYGEEPVASDASSRPKSPKRLEEQPLETGSNELAVPTTSPECITDSTTEYTVPTSFATETTDGYGNTNTNYASTTTTTTFRPSPLLPGNRDKIKIRVGSRFPAGRPTIQSYREGSDGSPSIQVPVYRPAAGLSHALRTSRPPVVFSPPRKNLLTLEDIYKSTEMKELGGGTPASPDPTSTPAPPTQPPTPPSGASLEDDEAEEYGAAGTTGRKVSAAASAVQVLSDPVTTSTQPPVQPSSSMSTKIVKTVRVRQRMRPGTYGSFLSKNVGEGGPLRSRAAGLSRIRVIQRPASQEYFKSFPEYAAPEGEVLGEEEQKEVKNALIDLKKI